MTPRHLLAHLFTLAKHASTCQTRLAGRAKKRAAPVLLVMSTPVVLAIPEGGLGQEEAAALLKYVLIVTLQDNVDESPITLLLVPTGGNHPPTST